MLYRLPLPLFAKSLKKIRKLSVVKEEDVNYVHLHNFKKITTSLFGLVAMLNDKCHKKVIEEVIIDVPFDQLFVKPFLSNYNIIKDCLYQFISFYKRRGDRF